MALAQTGWLLGFHPPGLNGRVVAAVIQPNGDIIAGGEFTNAGGHPGADYVARWNGRSWQALGQGPSRFTYLTSLHSLPNGHLLAAGVLLDSSKVRSVVTRWDGRRWQPLGDGLPGIWLSTLTVAPNGNVLVGFAGERQTTSGYNNGVLRWNGRIWQPLAPDLEAKSGQEALGSSITQLAVTPTGDIVAAGNFPDGRHATPAVARWTGTTWQRMGQPAQGYRFAETLALNASGEVLASGALTDAEGGRTNYVARWDGRTWQELGPHTPGKVVRLIVTPSGEILVHRVAFTPHATTRTTTIERWSGTRWQPLLPGPTQALDAQELLAIAPNGEVLAADPVFGLTRWDGYVWHPLSGPPTAGFPGIYPRGRVTVLAATREHDVFLAGFFFDGAVTHLGATQARMQVHRWNGRQRHVLGPDFIGSIEALVVARNGDLLAGGSFLLPGSSDSIRYIARWNGRRWQPVGTGLPVAARALAVAPNGDIWAGGDFGLSRWDGHRWQALPLPAPADSTYPQFRSTYVRALAVAPNGDVVVGGSFPGSNPYYDAHVIRWDGQRWQLLEGATEGFVNSLAVDHTGKVAVGSGATGHVHGFSSNWGSVARSDTTDGQVWAYPPTRFDGYVNSVAIAADGDIIAGGSFNTVDNLSIRNLARWHKGTWRAFPQHGLNGPVHTVVVAPNGDIIVGGNFTATGDGAQSLSLWGIYRKR